MSGVERCIDQVKRMKMSDVPRSAPSRGKRVHLSGEGGDCCVCNLEPSSLVSVECGHMVICTSCVSKMSRNETPWSTVCPHCSIPTKRYVVDGAKSSIRFFIW